MKASELGDLLWQPDEQMQREAKLTAFLSFVRDSRGISMETYDELWAWSIEFLEDFWGALWDFFAVGDRLASDIVLVERKMPAAQWFPGIRMNFAEFILGRGAEARPAIISTDESGVSRTLTWGEFRSRVTGLAGELRRCGVGHGDVVVGYVPNSEESIIAFLATAWLGAIWASVGLDYAASAVMDRFAQLEPKVLIAADGYQFAGNWHDRAADIVAIREGLPTVTDAIVIPRQRDGQVPSNWIRWETALAGEGVSRAQEVAFEDPLWVLFSSGTTGHPKGLVHGHGGITLESLKQFVLHWNLGPDDRVFWHTSPSWVMWNLQLGTLVSGGSIICYDGSPTYPVKGALWAVVEREQATFMGLSPGYLQASRDAGIVPRKDFDLSRLRAMGSTGSPLSVDIHSWATETVGDIPLWSISGGTDVATAFVAGAALVPVWAGEMSVRCLGVDLQSWNAQGQSVKGELGELVICQPMPSMPVYFWNDADGSKYLNAYFESFPGIWRQGDWTTVSERGSVIITGRSDSTLNRHGVRMGSADIYAIVEVIPGIRDSMVIGAEQSDGSYWMPLFVVLADGLELDDALCELIKERIRRQASPRHVPDEIIKVQGIPRTKTGKKLEIPIKRILQGARAEDIMNPDALEDPRLVHEYSDIAEAYRHRSSPAS